MAKNSGSRAVPENILHSELSQSSPDPISASGAVSQLTLPHVLPVLAFPMLGCVLYVVGMPVADIFTFLAGCGGIGAVVTIAVTGGRRVLVTLAHGILAAAGSK